MDFFFDEEVLMLIPGLISGIPTGLFSIAAYILTAIAIYTISRRRGLTNAWLAWIPVVNVWLLGSISDQYQYVVKGQDKSKRKWLLVLNILKAALLTMIVILAVVTAGVLFTNKPSELIGLGVAMLGLVLPLVAVMITLCVIRYIALYDVYRSLDPANAVLFLVLSILFNPTEPFFLFFSREKDLGMPPRKQQPVYDQEPVYTSVNDTEYL